MAEHHVAVTVKAPVHQVYTLFSHFNDFPKFMSFVKEVTYYDELRSHWVARVAGNHEWDAVNEDWIVDRQIGWRSTSGLQNAGKVKFTPVGENETMVDVFLTYTPPVGKIGEVIDKLGFDTHFDKVLQQDLDAFAQLVAEAPPGALDPMQSHYIFNKESALAKGKVTDQQRDSMQQDPMMSDDALKEHATGVQKEVARGRNQAQEQDNQLQEVQRAQQENAARQSDLAREETAARQYSVQDAAQQREVNPAYDALGEQRSS